MRRILITGGAGFIGSNLADHFLGQGDAVVVYDNLSRPGTEENLRWLEANHPQRLEVVRGDVRHAEAVADVVKDVDVVYHLAAQVAVTTSVTDPRSDFEINALGTFNVVEGVRRSGHKPVLIYTSTNKVYGRMEDVTVVEQETRYAYRDLPWGVAEGRPLDFHSPYGCSKGAADQYVRDYARIYDLPHVVFRMSCIYGPRQFGTEDQGWVAHFVIASVLGRPIVIYGDGKQVRDVLFVSDLVRAFELAIERIDVTAGQVYNIGGGPENTLSVWAEFGPLLRELTGRDIAVGYGNWRPGDQKVYISDVRKAGESFGWEPLVSCRQGVAALVDWVRGNQELFG